MSICISSPRITEAPTRRTTLVLWPLMQYALSNLARAPLHTRSICGYRLPADCIAHCTLHTIPFYVLGSRCVYDSSRFTNLPDPPHQHCTDRREMHFLRLRCRCQGEAGMRENSATGTRVQQKNNRNHQSEQS